MDKLNEVQERIKRAEANPDRQLDLSGLSLVELPESVLLPRGLSSLDVSHNFLSTLPASLSQLSALRTLDVSSNDLRSLPDPIYHLANLRTLDASKNRISSLEESISMLKELRSLDLSSNELETLPNSIGNLVKLSDFDVSDNRLSDFPDQADQLSRLKRLIIYSNRLRIFPKSIKKMSALESLSISDNPIRSLSDCFQHLGKLRYLGIAGTNARKIPECMRTLTMLSYLALGNGKWRKIPSWIGELTELRGLDVSCADQVLLRWEGDNYAWSSVSFGEGHVKNKTGIVDPLPESIQKLRLLRQIYLHGNKYLQIPPEILGKSWMEVGYVGSEPVDAEASRILEYYFRARRGKQPLNEAKLILVGRGGAGKTCLIKRLVDNTFNENEPETPGIEIRTWPVHLSDGDLVRLHVWDFGGQEILHATHQFFLTERTLYLLVLSGREGNPTADAEYWLQLIKSFGGASRVIIALNKSSQHPFDVNRGLLLEKYPFISEFIRTDCKSLTPGTKRALGINELNDAILRQTELMEHRKADFPADWFAIKERLAGMEEDFVTWDQYQHICRTLGEMEPQAQRDLARFLHILGIALNYTDDPRLHDTRVLKPRWVTDGIYTLLRAGQIAEKKGVLSLADMAGVLDSVRYPLAKHDFLLGLMERFQLCFRLSGTGERYLVPELLGDSQPDLTDILASSGLSFRYQYEVLPEGLLPRFIVQTHAYSADDSRSRWRSGVILDRGGCRAVVRADIRERRVDVHIGGPEMRRRGLLEIIRAKFEEQHRDLKGLAVDERVPIQGEPGVTISYHHLLVLEDEGEEWCRPEGAQHSYRVVDLLNGIESAELRAHRREARSDLRIGDQPTQKQKASSGQSDGINLHPKRHKVFVSYSHKDRKEFDDFKLTLAPVIRRGIVDIWDDQRIVPGAKWKDEILAALAATRVAVLLVSKNFLASDFIAKNELPPLLKSAQEEGVVVYWIYLSACLYEHTEIVEFQAAHDIKRPLSDLKRPQREAVLNKVCAKLIEIAQGS